MFIWLFILEVSESKRVLAIRHFPRSPPTAIPAVPLGRIELLHSAQNVRRLHTTSNLARRWQCLYIVLQIRSVAGAILDVTVTASR